MSDLRILSPEEIIPTMADAAKIYTSMLHYEAAQKTPEKDSWNKSHFRDTPWGIAFLCSKASHDRSVASAKAKGWDKHGGYKPPVPKNDVALKAFVVSVIIGWDELTKQLKRTLLNWGYTVEDLETTNREIWGKPENAAKILKAINDAIAATGKIDEQVSVKEIKTLSEAIEKHEKLNSKLFTKDEVLKETVRKKMLEIVEEFLKNLQEQNIEIKVDDVLLVGSNANYNYTKDSDIDLHLIADTKKMKYNTDVADALYSAYRTLFNKNLDINIYDIPLELYVETEKTPRNSNGVYSVKKDKWEKKPVQEEIPEYNKEALTKLVDKWEAKCKDLLDKIAADKLQDEKKVIKLLEDIYEKLRKTGVAKSEYAIENLAFKELRNKGYLDKLKLAKHELISKRLSLEERLDAKAHRDVEDQITMIAGSRPRIQDNGMFFIYNLKEKEISHVVNALRRLPFVTEVYPHETGKYDFSNVLDMAMNKIPSKYYDIRGRIDETLI
jgi:predicted nucleotidyltransferase